MIILLSIFGAIVLLETIACIIYIHDEKGGKINIQGYRKNGCEQSLYGAMFAWTGKERGRHDKTAK